LTLAIGVCGGLPLEVKLAVTDRVAGPEVARIGDDAERITVDGPARIAAVLRLPGREIAAVEEYGRVARRSGVCREWWIDRFGMRSLYVVDAILAVG
jgi:hypothetical protein